MVKGKTIDDLLFYLEKLYIPKPNIHVMITFEVTYFIDSYTDKKGKKTVTKKGWYISPQEPCYGYYDHKDNFITPIDGYFIVPPSWADHGGVSLPSGWGGNRVLPENVIKWEYIKNENRN